MSSRRKEAENVGGGPKFGTHSGVGLEGDSQLWGERLRGCGAGRWVAVLRGGVGNLLNLVWRLLKNI